MKTEKGYLMQRPEGVFHVFYFNIRLIIIAVYFVKKTKSVAEKRPVSVLDTILMDFSTAEHTAYWTVRNAVEGVQIFGGIGSGKTSGSGKTIAMQYLSNGFGGLVLTAKHDEKELWQQYCKAAGREQDLIIVEPGSRHYFNFLEYESTVSGQSLTANIVQVLKTVISAGKGNQQQTGDDNFWEGALDMLLSNSVDLCLLAYGRVTVRDLYEIAQSAPKRPVHPPSQPPEKTPDNPFRKAYNIAMDKMEAQVEAWKAGLSQAQLNSFKSSAEFTVAASEQLPDVRLMGFISNFFTDSYRNMADKTRSIVDFYMAGFLYSLLREPVYSLFCRHPSNFTPEDSLEGKIILINLPVKDYYKVGKDTQVMFKYIWQRAMERRRIQENGRPVFLWADEAQHFLHEHDAEYQATARSSRIATVYISQNLPNYFGNMGGKSGEYKVKSFLGTLGTKIFHANADMETNRYASDLLGEGWQRDDTESISTADGKVSHSNTITSKLQKVVRPEEFGLLKTGGPDNNNTVTGYVHVQGKKFSNGFNYRKIIIHQH